MTCSRPIDAVVLADYWLAVLDEPDEQRVEEHLLECDACGDRLREVVALAEGVREVAQQGTLRLIVSDTFLQRAQEKGLAVRQYAPPNGGSVQCTVTAADDLLIGRLAADLSAAGQVDLSLCDESGTEQFRLRDIPFRQGPADVIVQVSIDAMKAAPSMKLTAHLLAADEEGRERSLGDYTFNHTRSIADPQ